MAIWDIFEGFWLKIVIFISQKWCFFTHFCPKSLGFPLPMFSNSENGFCKRSFLAKSDHGWSRKMTPPARRPYITKTRLLRAILTSDSDSACRNRSKMRYWTAFLGDKYNSVVRRVSTAQALRATEPSIFISRPKKLFNTSFWGGDRTPYLFLKSLK